MRSGESASGAPDLRFKDVSPYYAYGAFLS